MSPVRATWRRTLGAARNSLFTAFAVGGCLSAMGLLLAFNVGEAEGSRQTLPVLWAVSVAPVMPVLAALLAMGVWSDERRSGRIEILLSTAVRERDLAVGKFLGVWTMTLLTAVFSIVVFWAFLGVLAPDRAAADGLIGFLPALLGIALQSLLWCAVSVAASAFFDSSAAAACLSVVLTLGLPNCVWAGLMAWSREGRVAFGQNPIAAQALDMASGVVSFFALMTCLIGSAAFLFVSAKCVAAVRLVGRGARVWRLSTGLAIFLSLAFAVLAAGLAFRLDFTIDIPVSGARSRLSLRTHNILRESEGVVDVTCFLSRSDIRFREVGRFLRLLKRESKSLGGASFVLQYVDPRWDVGAAERLVGRGVTENCLVFERGRRLVSVPLEAGGLNERDCASAIRRLATVPRRRNVYWTVGHGESRFDDYGPFGMSDIARDLVRDGYSNRTLDLATADQVPGDCALIVVAGARDLFSRSEFGRLESYLREGGRVLVLVGSSWEGGLSPMLPAWGVRLSSEGVPGGATLSGSDVIVSDFADHPLAAPLAGSRIVLERPAAFLPSAVVEAKFGADRVDYTPLARSGEKSLAVAVERGGGVGSDLAIRPARLVVVGDASFVMNAPLAARANANRDFFLNCAAYLSGTDALGAAGTESGLFLTGFDREGRFRFMLWIAVAVPGSLILILLTVAYRRRRRV